MKIIYNNLLPVKGFKAISLFGIIFARKDAGPIDAETINHETIHLKQQQDLLFIGFFIWYIIEYVIRLFLPGDAYRNISFERQAFDSESDVSFKYKRFSFLYYINNKQKP